MGPLRSSLGGLQGARSLAGASCSVEEWLGRVPRGRRSGCSLGTLPGCSGAATIVGAHVCMRDVSMVQEPRGSRGVERVFGVEVARMFCVCVFGACNGVYTCVFFGMF